MPERDGNDLADLMRAAAPEFEPLTGERVRDEHPQRGRRPRTVLVLAAACALVVGLSVAVAFVAHRHGRPSAGPATRSVATSAPPASTADQVADAVARKAPCDADPTTPEPHVGAAVIARFHTRVVVNCLLTSRRYDDGEWSVLVRQVAIAGTEALEAALVRPDEPFEPKAPKTYCTAIGYLYPSFLLADGAGHYLRPLFPSTTCGAPQTAYTQALAAVRFRTVSITKLTKVS